jgi:biotin synthase
MTVEKWNKEKIAALYDMPLIDLLLNAQTIHREHFPPNEVQISTVMSIKTGACPEDCAFCSQSGHFKTKILKEKLLPKEKVLDAAKRAKEMGATRFCMGAAWRGPSDKDLDDVIDMIKAIKPLGMETCTALGSVTLEQAKKLKDAGLDYYNHNLETSPEYYKEIVTTHEFQDRVNTVNHIASAGINVCCGGLLGMGETREDRINLFVELVSLPTPPKSLPLNIFDDETGNQLSEKRNFEIFEFVRSMAIARILFPKTKVRITGGRRKLSDEAYALCYLAGANSIHLGEKLLTFTNRLPEQDFQLFKKMGITSEPLPTLED